MMKSLEASKFVHLSVLSSVRLPVSNAFEKWLETGKHGCVCVCVVAQLFVSVCMCLCVCVSDKYGLPEVDMGKTSCVLSFRVIFAIFLCLSFLEPYLLF